MMTRRWIILSLCFVMLFSLCAVPAHAEETDPYAEAAQKILENQLETSGASDVQGWLDGALSEGAGGAGDWYALTLASLPEHYDYSGYAAALSGALKHREGDSLTTRQKYSLMLLACGYYDSYVEETAAACSGELTVMELIYGLHLLNNYEAGGSAAEALQSALLAAQLEDGGWAISGTVSDPDVTAMAVQALAPACGADEKISAAVDAALSRLSGLQQENGCYMSYGTANPESCAQMVIALCALGIDPTVDERFCKAGGNVLDAMLRFRLEDGSFSHTEGGSGNALATREAWQALTAYLRLRETGSGNIYLLPLAGERREISEAASAAAEKTEGEEAAPDEAQQGESPVLSIRTVLTVAAAAGTVLACLLFLLLGKRSWKNFAFALVLGGAVIGGLQLLQIETPEQYYGASGTGGTQIRTVISIRCDTVAGMADHIPTDGVILAEEEILIPEGATAYEQLMAAARTHELLIENNGGSYIKTINNISELQYGSLSGWMYLVNGEFADVNSNEYVLQEGDFVEWVYSCEIGKDIVSTWQEGAE